MKKVITVVALLAFALSTTACRETTQEKSEEALEAVGNDIEAGLEEAGDAIENAAEETGKAIESVGNEIEEEIEGTDDTN